LPDGTLNRITVARVRSFGSLSSLVLQRRIDTDRIAAYGGDDLVFLRGKQAIQQYNCIEMQKSPVLRRMARLDSSEPLVFTRHCNNQLDRGRECLRGRNVQYLYLYIYIYI
jgi:hypothetical protein